MALSDYLHADVEPLSYRARASAALLSIVEHVSGPPFSLSSSGVIDGLALLITEYGHADAEPVADQWKSEQTQEQDHASLLGMRANAEAALCAILGYADEACDTSVLSALRTTHAVESMGAQLTEAAQDAARRNLNRACIVLEKMLGAGTMELREMHGGEAPSLMPATVPEA